MTNLDPYPVVEGHCPMGCGESLFLAAGGHITCRAQNCPRPDAVATILDDRETEHIVLFDANEFTLQHPLRERLDDDLFACSLHQYCAELAGPPPQFGTYRVVRRSDGSWDFASTGRSAGPAQPGGSP